MRVGRLLAAVAVAVIALVTVPARPAGAVPIFDEPDAIELANTLAEALDDQDVCYGWIVSVQDDDGTFSGTDQGSSLGPGRDPRETACAPSVIFVADLHYTSELSESGDSARYRVDSTLPGFDTSDLSSLGVSSRGLLGANDDLVVRNAVALLPALVAEQGLAPAIVAEETTGTIPDADRPTGTPSSDTLRTYWPVYVLTGLVAAAGLVWLAFALFLRAEQRRDPHFTFSSMLQQDD